MSPQKFDLSNFFVYIDARNQYHTEAPLEVWLVIIFSIAVSLAIASLLEY